MFKIPLQQYLTNDDSFTREVRRYLQKQFNQVILFQSHTFQGYQ